jgi:myo-inositol catabolism protein IolC
MPLGHDGRLYFLAFDHRAAFARSVFGTDGEPTPSRRDCWGNAKRQIFAGVERAVRGVAMRADEPGVLVDELYGAAVARDARDAGAKLAMPVDAPDRAIFEFAYGNVFGGHTTRTGVRS